jgi:phosphoglycolate phosphatase
MKTALFDLDGTLIDSREDLALAVNLTRQDFGLAPISVEAVVACVGEGVRALIQRAIPERPDLWGEMLARQRQHYGDHLLDRTALYPGVEETLRTLRRAGWKLGVVTNKPSAASLKILGGLGVLGCFDAVAGGGDCAALKPDPAPLLLAAQRLASELTPQDWMVGDNFTDLEAGERAGLRRCFCRYGFGELRGAGYELAVDRLDEWLKYL